MGWGGQGGCEWRSEAFVKIQKKQTFLGGRGSSWGVGQGRWERRIEAFVKIKKKIYFFLGGGVGRGQGGASGGGVRVRVDVKREVKFL